MGGDAADLDEPLRRCGRRGREADFFLDFRRFISSHEDTFVTGPTTAADYLAMRKKK
jgi:hypothetical protein